MILVRYHKKAPEFAELLRKFVIYWVELMEEQTNGGQMTVIMSCVGAGLSNLVSAFKVFYFKIICLDFNILHNILQ